MNNTHHKFNNKTTKFGFWLYIMSDCVLFASLFAVFLVLSNDTSVSCETKNIFKLNLVFIETCCLLLSSLTYGNAMIHVQTETIQKIKLWMVITLFFGLSFISIEIYEFYHLIEIGNTPWKNAFFSSFFVLVGTHGLHVIAGLIWIIIMIIHLTLNGITLTNQTRLQCLSLFWHFLDIVWICVFTIVYLMSRCYS